MCTDDRWICRTGASSPKPIQEGFELIEPNSVLFNTYSGPVVRGYKVDPDTVNAPGVLKPCGKDQVTGDGDEPGTYQPTFFGNECKKCMKGRYCDELALDDVQSKLCDAGHFCDEGNIRSNPDGTDVDENGDPIVGRVCDSGKYCSGPLIHEQDCPDGFIS